MKHQTLIIGSSPFALGYATTHKNTVIFEKSILIEPIFAGTLSNPSVPNIKNEYTCLFVSDNSLKNGKVDILRSEVLLSKYALDKKIKIYFATFIINIKKQNDLYSVTYFDNEGKHVELFKKIIKVEDAVKNNKYSVLIDTKIDSFPTKRGVKIERDEAFHDDTEILTFSFNKKLTPCDAKEKIFPILKEMLNGKGKVLVCAHHTFSDKVSEPYTDNMGILNVSDRFFNDPATAFSFGERGEL